MSGSLVNIGELSKPATVLVERISDAVGGFFKPYQIERVARAEAEAAEIRAKTEVEISELQERAINRFVAEEAQKQKNIEDIGTKALAGVQESADPEEVEDDWIVNFFDKCRLISDEEMQDLWARVLSGEANQPGSYSKRIVNFLSSMGTHEPGNLRIYAGLQSIWMSRSRLSMILMTLFIKRPMSTFKASRI